MVGGLKAPGGAANKKIANRLANGGSRRSFSGVNQNAQFWFIFLAGKRDGRGIFSTLMLGNYRLKRGG
jgi:hypothetical protein